MRRLVVGSVVLLWASLSVAQELKERPAPPHMAPQVPRAMANNEASYQQLRSIALSGEVIPVNGFRMKRDAGTFTFRSGDFYLLQPVNKKVTGAVFIGEASLGVFPPIEVERRYLSILAKDNEFVEQFSEAVFRFTGGTEEEIRGAVAPPDAAVSARSGEAAGLLHDLQGQLRNHLKENLDARLLEDVLSSQHGGKFIAFIKGKRYGGKLIYDIDPNGVTCYFPDPPPLYGDAGPNLQQYFSLAPEEVALVAWDYNHFGIWTSFHYAQEYEKHTASSTEQNGPFRIDHQKLDVAFDKGGRLAGLAETTVTAQHDGVRVLGLDLFPTLRVDWVAGSAGEPLPFIQEATDQDANFAVVLPRELKRGESYVITTRYGGKDAVSNESNGNYYPNGAARDKWYPNLRFGSYATYEIALHVPKGLRMVATGKLLKTVEEGHETVTNWTSEVPLAVAGFNFGDYKTQEAEDLSHHYRIETDVNANASSMIEGLRNPFSGTMSTVPMMKKATAEAQLALDLYSKFFGQNPYSKLAMTQQNALGYGQSWPGLVFLPASYFLDSTARHTIGFGNEHGFFKSVGPHEISHQWWGHMVGFNSYRDQWMSEGFAELSASLFLQYVYTDHGLDDYHEFWAYERKLLTDTNAQSRRAIDVGPLTLGYRLATAKTGANIPRNLIYPKGAYVLQMLRLMMQDSSKDPDTHFKAMMQDFTATYANRAASTEDFKAMVEKHMAPYMDIDRNHRMDWFFDEYVYGTDFPNYKLEHSFATDPDGTVLVNFKLTQSKVSDKFVMLVPIYVELSGGRFARLGRVSMRGNTTIERQVRLPKGAERPQKLSISYLDDILAHID